MIAAIAISVGVVFFLVGKGIGVSFWANVVFALGIIVALVPEGLLPEVTLALATCSKRMAKRNALVRHLASVETLGCASVICTDKTGTLTENKMKVTEINICGMNLRRQMFADLKAECADAFFQMCMVALNCENVHETVKEGHQQLTGDSMEIALVEFARDTSCGINALPRIGELPFDTLRKRVATMHQWPQGGRCVYVKGALETVLPLCAYYHSKNGVSQLDEKGKDEIVLAHESMTKRGLRVIATCWRQTAEASIEESESQMTFIGLIGLEDPPRKEVPDAIAACHRAGIKVIMITGDHPNTAQAIAKQIGLFDAQATPLVVTGSALRDLSETQLDLMLHRQDLIFARTEAEQKMRIVLALRRAGHIVAVTGDGVNDAPALKAADIGVAMGLSGTDVARQASDLVLADDNFASIVNAIKEGRAVFSNIQKFLTYVLSSNVAELIPCLAFVLFNIPLPLTVMQVLSIDLCADILPALALGSERPEAEVMSASPRSKKRAYSIAHC